ncbi:MAG: T9SS type A sorting domain-containing protein [Chitinophagales bacterium]
MHRIFYTLLLFLAFQSSIFSTDCFNGRYKQKIFQDVTITSDVKYAKLQRSDGAWLDYKYDVYQPKNDTAQNRPLVVLAHGGAYLEIPLLDKKSPDIVELALDLTQKGYVVISIGYRLETNLLSLLSEENMIKAVGRAVMDARLAFCRIVDTTLHYNNPYRIDLQSVFIGGVSAGTVSFLHGMFLDSISQMPNQYRQWIEQVVPNAQQLLDDKFCGANILGMINVSGAVLDTAWIKPNRQYPALLSQHGTVDVAIPYSYGHPFGLPMLPNLMGSSLIDKRYKNLGLRSELETWVNYNHVPFVGGLNLGALFGQNPLAVVFNPYVLDSTKRHITNFCYSLLTCDALTTGIKQHLMDSPISIFPNPSNGSFQIKIPFEAKYQNGTIDMYDISGKNVYQTNFPVFTENVFIDKHLPNGAYFIKLAYQKDEEEYIYTSKINIVH